MWCPWWSGLRAAGVLAIVLAPHLARAALEKKDVETLLSRLDLDRPELAGVKAAAADPARAAAELLAYYRGRTTVQHPEVSRGDRVKSKGRGATAAELAVADDALRNVLITCPEMPRFDFGSRIDWLTNRHPKQDPEWIVQLHRQYSWTALAKAYWHSGEERYAEAYARQLADWLTACAPENPAAGIPWRRLEMGIRGHAWTCHFHYFLDSPAYTPELLVRQLNSFHEHAVRLVAKPYTRNNWGLMEAEGTAFIAMTFPEFKEAAAWRKHAIAYLVEQIDRQVLPDGMHTELCFGYHRGAIAWLDRTRQLAAGNGLAGEFPASYARTIERMYEVLGRAAHPNGHQSMFGDDRAADIRPYLGQGARAFPQNQALAFLASDGQAGAAPPTALHLPSAGLYSFRSGWDAKAIHLIMKCGPDGGWHSQPDNGSFELFAFGHYLMPDSGCYVYGGDKEGRAWFRQTQVHQTLTLNGQNSTSKGTQLLWHESPECDAVVVENASYPGLTHRRGVLFVKAQPRPFFVLLDDALGEAAGELDLHFQLAPGRSVISTERFTARTDLAEGNVVLRCLGPAGAEMAEEAGQVSFAYEKKEPRPAVRVRVAKTGAVPAVGFVTVLVPYAGGNVPAVELAGDAAGAGQRAARVTVEGVGFRVGYDVAGKKAWGEAVGR